MKKQIDVEKVKRILNDMQGQFNEVLYGNEVEPETPIVVGGLYDSKGVKFILIFNKVNGGYNLISYDLDYVLLKAPTDDKTILSIFKEDDFKYLGKAEIRVRGENQKAEQSSVKQECCEKIENKWDEDDLNLTADELNYCPECGAKL